MLGILLCLVGVIICYRTTVLMIRVAGNDEEYFHTLYKYWGNWAYDLGMFSTLMIIIAAVCAYFIMMSQMMYPILLSLIDWIFRTNLTIIDRAAEPLPTFNYFS